MKPRKFALKKKNFFLQDSHADLSHNITSNGTSSSQTEQLLHLLSRLEQPGQKTADQLLSPEKLSHLQQLTMQLAPGESESSVLQNAQSPQSDESYESLPSLCSNYTITSGTSSDQVKQAKKIPSNNMVVHCKR